jgi:co-chaperonin GroES (HSP10)
MPSLMKMVHETDPADEIMRELAEDLANIEPMFNQVMVATYVRPEKTKGGIILAENSGPRKEDLYQGKTGLVVKLGPTAFMDDGAVKFHGQKVAVGDWVVFRPSDGWKLLVNGREVRVLQDVFLKAKIASPDLVF